MDILERFSINPDTNIMDVLGHSGYTFNFAIADLIDNCISANAKNIKIFFDIFCTQPYFYILDDGNGMKLEQLKQAAVIGAKDITEERDSCDLGRFSTGLKSAANSLCYNMFISSKVMNEAASTIQLDFTYIKKNNSWDAFVVKNTELEDLIAQNGTLVYCNNLKLTDDYKNTSFYNKLDDLESSIAHIFGKFILENGIKISIQVKGSKEIVIKGWNPFGLIHCKSIKSVYENSIKYKNGHIFIKAYIMPVFNNLNSEDQKYMEGKGLINQQGFYIYRNNRLIQEGGWLDLPKLSLDDKSKYARIEVNFTSSLDEEFKVNFSKNFLIIPNDLTDMFLKVAKKARLESRNSANYISHPEFKKTFKSDTNKIWQTTHSNIGTSLIINPEHPIILELCHAMSSQEKKKLFQVLSKSIPISMIQEQNIGLQNYSENDIWELANAMYKKMIAENMSISEIKTKLKNMEPFKDYIQYLISFFDNLEDTNE